MNRKTIRLLAFTITGLCAIHALAAEPPLPPQALPPAVEPVELPAPAGPYKVGTVTWHVTDPARPETFAAAGVQRQVEVMAWYPAAASPGTDEPAPYLREGLAEIPPGLRAAFGSLANVRTHAFLDSPPVATPATFPVLVFSHGFGGFPSSYTALLEDLASHGYAVLSIVHPYEATAATLAGGTVVSMFDAAGKPRQSFTDVIAEWSKEDETMAAVTHEAKEDDQRRRLREYLAGLHATTATVDRWVADTKLVLDRLPALPKDSAAGRLAAKLDLGRLGAFGHSMGGVVSGQFCLDDRRCRAGLNLDGIPQYGSMIDRHMAQPFLMVYSARPGRAGASDAIYRRAAARYYRCDVRDTLHLDFSDAVLWGGPFRKNGALGTLPPARTVEITRTIVRQYFDQELLGRPSPLLAGKTALPEVTVKMFPEASK
jgi:predicted dienelactone hydrolase